MRIRVTPFFAVAAVLFLTCAAAAGAQDLFPDGPGMDILRTKCRNCHMPESKWLFDIRSNNGGPIPNATALGSLWMTRNVSSVVNTVFYVHPRTQAHWRKQLGLNDIQHRFPIFLV